MHLSYPENVQKISNFQNIYKEDLIKKNKIDKKIKAVVACGNGTAGVFAPEILRGIGCEVIELDCNLDYAFPKYNPNPEDLEMLRAISKCVIDIMQISVLDLMVTVIVSVL